MYTGIKAILDREFVLSKATNKPYISGSERGIEEGYTEDL